MHRFLSNNRDDLIARCKVKVAHRPRRQATDLQLAHGVPMFLDQLTRTLVAEENDEQALSIRISGPSGGDASNLSEIGVSATRHGKELLDLGYTVDQVVHDYGDLCQAITDLAFEYDAPFAVQEFRTLNRCLDNAIADAVTAFSLQRDARMASLQVAQEKQRLGFLIHELRNSAGTATLAVRALELGGMAITGATGAILKRSLSSLVTLIDRAIGEASTGSTPERLTFSVESFIVDAGLAGRLDASLLGCEFEVLNVDPALSITAHRNLLHSALTNLLQNAFKFTRTHTVVTLSAVAVNDRVHIEVADHCGGLPPGDAARLFIPFAENDHRKAGMGLGLSIARHSVESDLGTLTVRDIPGKGCVFTINLPLAAHTAAPEARLRP